MIIFVVVFVNLKTLATDFQTGQRLYIWNARQHRRQHKIYTSKIMTNSTDKTVQISA